MQRRVSLLFLYLKFKFYSSSKEVEIFSKDGEIWHLTEYRENDKYETQFFENDKMTEASI